MFLLLIVGCWQRIIAWCERFISPLGGNNQPALIRHTSRCLLICSNICFIFLFNLLNMCSKKFLTGWHKALKRRSDAARKSQLWTKILTPNIRCFVAKSALSQITRFNCLIFLTPNIRCFVTKLSLSRITHLN